MDLRKLHIDKTKEQNRHRGVEIPPLAKELLATVIWWEENQFLSLFFFLFFFFSLFKGMAQVGGPAPMVDHTVQSIRTALIVFDELHKDEDTGWMDREGWWT